MRDPARIERITKKLAQVWIKRGYADMRLGQLIVNIGQVDFDPWFVEDDEWERKLDDILMKGELDRA